MRHITLVATILVVMVVVADSWANGSQLAWSVEKSITNYGRQPALFADVTMSIVTPR